ncbi:MAG: RluA family pseudouridine synthase [bacterium]|nr:RluA family pseudouridine synthase [bacterium]
MGSNMIRRLEYSIKEKDMGKPIGKFLKEKGYSTTILTSLKKTTYGIQKNQVHAFVNERLAVGDTLTICIEEQVEAEELISLNCELDILYEDEDLLVVNKPYNMPIHPSINNYHNTLANAVSNYYKKKNEAYVFRCINRLDRDTTGATIIAKNVLSASILSDQVKDRKIHRTYLALVEGETKEQGIIDLPIGRKEGSVIERMVDIKNGKRAVTHFHRVKTIKVKDKQVSLAKLKLETGRTHQIRVHMSYVGHPLLGDFLYNEECRLMKRQALHSAELRFIHPISGREIKILAPLPEDMEGVLQEGSVR